MSKNPARNFFALVLLAILSLSTAAATAEIGDKPAAIEALVKTYEDTQTFNGAVLVAEKGRVIFKKGFGLADREWNVPNRPDTKSARRPRTTTSTPPS